MKQIFQENNKTETKLLENQMSSLKLAVTHGIDINFSKEIPFIRN